MKPVYWGSDNVVFVNTYNTIITATPKSELPVTLANYDDFTIS